MHNTDNITEGVKCVVSSCHYYKSGDQCTAGQIEIQPKNATTADETDCGTFRPNNMT